MPPERTSGGFGGRLRDARERRGMSLRQIANATKISVAVLEALERNDISKLPGGIFGRAFVRSYAIEVGPRSRSDDPGIHRAVPERLGDRRPSRVRPGRGPRRGRKRSPDGGNVSLAAGDQRAGRGRPAVLRHARPPRSGGTAAGADRRAGVRATCGGGTSPAPAPPAAEQPAALRRPPARRLPRWSTPPRRRPLPLQPAPAARRRRRVRGDVRRSADRRR